MKIQTQCSFVIVLLCALTTSEVASTESQPSRGNPTKPSARDAVTLEVPQLKLEKYKLDNGLEVILHEDHRLPMVAVNLWYHVGPANELPGRTGFAHLFEHMMFEGSKHVARNAHYRLLEAAGASNINATTGFDRTNYFEVLPSNQLELALWLESDRMGYLPDRLDQASLSNQQDVVRNERRQMVENTPYGIADEKMFHLLFPKEHPYYSDVMGSHQDIQAATLEDARNFFRMYYAPNNASLVIAGDFDSAQAKQFVEKYFGPLRRGALVPTIQASTPPITAQRRAVVNDNVQLPVVYIAWLTSPIFKPGDADADLTARILGVGKSSRLYKKLVYDNQIAVRVSAEQRSLALASVFDIKVTAKSRHAAEEIERAVDEEIEALRKTGPTEAEVMRARSGTESTIIQGLEMLGGLSGLAERLNSYNHYLGTPDFLAADIARYENATPDTVKAFVESQLRPTARVVVYAVPGKQDLGPEASTPKAGKESEAKGGVEAVNVEAAWRATPPMPGPAARLHLPVPAEFKLPNGLTVLYSARPGLPIVAANLVLRSGSNANPLNRPGLAAMTAAMLQQGTTTLTATQIADRGADLGATLNTDAGSETSNVSIRSLSRSFPQALALLADMVQHPTFLNKELERQRSQRLAALVQEKDEPFRVLHRVKAIALYGPKSPFGFPPSGTVESLRVITREDVLHFWQQNYSPTNAALVVAGSITESELRALVEKDLGAWKQGTVANRSLPTPEPTNPRLILVNRVGAVQTATGCILLGPSRTTPDYVPLEVMNTELGVLFSSRINLNLREKHGYTYGALSFFDYRRGPSPFLAGGAIRTDATAPAVLELLNEVRRMRDTSMTPEELALAKDFIARSLPDRFETASAAAATFGDLFQFGLPLDYYSKFPNEVNAVTAEQAQAAAQKYLVPEKMIVVAVGDKAKIEGDLGRLNLGPAEHRDAEGNVVR